MYCPSHGALLDLELRFPFWQGGARPLVVLSARLLRLFYAEGSTMQLPDPLANRLETL